MSGIIRDKIAGNARESVKGIVFTSEGSTGFDGMPNFGEDSGLNRSADVRSAEQYEKGNLPGVNVYKARKR